LKITKTVLLTSQLRNFYIEMEPDITLPAKHPDVIISKKITDIFVGKNVA